MAVGLVLVGVSCAPPKTIPPSEVPTAPTTGLRGPVPEGGGAARAKGGLESKRRVQPAGRGPVAEPSPPLLGWMVLSDPRWLVHTLGRVGASQGGAAAGQAEAEREGALAADGAARLLGVDPRAVAGLDVTRPIVAGWFADPSATATAPDGPSSDEEPAFPDEEGNDGAAMPVPATPPAVALLLPIGDRRAFESGLDAAGAASGPAGLRVVASARGPLFVRITPAGPREARALVATRATLLAGPATTTLAALAPAGTQAEAPLVVHLDVARLYALHGARIEVVLAHVAALMRGDAGDPQAAWSTRQARRLIGYADSVESVELLASADDSGVVATLRAIGRHDGAFARLVSARAPTAPWGLEVLPADAVLVYVTHRDRATAEDDASVAADWLAAAADLPSDARARGAFREALAGALDEMPGEMVHAVWPSRDGGIGLGGAFRVREGGAARKAVLASYRRVAQRLGGAVATSLHLDPARFPVAVRVREGAGRARGVPVDEVTAEVRWPRDARAERRQFEALFGSRLSFDVAIVGEHALFAAGRDARARLDRMVARAKGGDGDGLTDDARFNAALSFRREGRVSFSWLSTGGMAGFLERVVATAQRTRHPGDTGPAPSGNGPLRVAAGEGAIVSTTNASGRRYEITTRLPTSALPGLPRVGLLLWRMALAPILNPPALPPLPMPPAPLLPTVPSGPAPEGPGESAVPRRRL